MKKLRHGPMFYVEPGGVTVVVGERARGRLPAGGSRGISTEDRGSCQRRSEVLRESE